MAQLNSTENPSKPRDLLFSQAFQCFFFQFLKSNRFSQRNSLRVRQSRSVQRRKKSNNKPRFVKDSDVYRVEKEQKVSLIQCGSVRTSPEECFIADLLANILLFNYSVRRWLGLLILSGSLNQELRFSGKQLIQFSFHFMPLVK